MQGLRQPSGIALGHVGHWPLSMRFNWKMRAFFSFFFLLMPAYYSNFSPRV